MRRLLPKSEYLTPLCIAPFRPCEPHVANIWLSIPSCSIPARFAAGPILPELVATQIIGTFSTPHLKPNRLSGDTEYAVPRADMQEKNHEKS
ncbi:hypothetical protein Bxe_C1299 [Paraburkholderia xenovorans LB400]|uniref:Uncharacterized protein n=1 Tax=Paraburkholderia xenovorans (strain LB400) TaxID=266265 RepID=Q13FI1_PARXL|nr:hypothetical protein Bxe_C1299 [Paraburkholderia xenovorans LB400]